MDTDTMRLAATTFGFAVTGGLWLETPVDSDATSAAGQERTER